jgi:hypothetical protein
VRVEQVATFIENRHCSLAQGGACPDSVWRLQKIGPKTGSDMQLTGKPSLALEAGLPIAFDVTSEKSSGPPIVGAPYAAARIRQS